jgi:hypothetical protein
MLLDVIHIILIFLPLGARHKLKLHLHATVGEVHNLLALGSFPVKVDTPLNQVGATIQIQEDHFHPEIIEDGNDGEE